MMHGGEKSDPVVVAGKSANAGGQPCVEPMEPRAGAEGNAVEHGTRRTLGRESVSSGLDRVRQRAREKKEEKFTTLLHHVDVDLLRSAYGWLAKDAAAGVDGVTWREYGQELEPQLEDLKDRIHRGAYRALPSRRVYIPKPDGRQRPLGIAALEDKIVQRAVVEVLNAIYEEDFLGFSYGFRPGRGQHDALDALAVGITRRRVNFILDADIAGFFDTVSHDWLIKFVEHRIADRRLVRLIRKWLKAGVMEAGVVRPGTVGTPQGAVISPLLANIYLHYVLDLWAQQWRQRHAQGDVILVRYADDIVVGFEHQAEAERFLAELRERMRAFGLTLHPEKTRLIEFGRFAATNRRARGLGKPETFNFLGFTHICGRSRRGGFQLKRKSRRDRMRTKLRAVKEALRRRMHEPVDEQGEWLGRVVRGFFAYHAVPTNSKALAAFGYHVTALWLRTLRHRSQRDRTPWSRVRALADRWLPKPAILHPRPERRFAVRHPRWEPDARIGHVRFCAGGAW
ncbi:MAG TPA: group II intron reverse transcriptase/maturase [Alphaproteobacteria bacterium]|jgi:RNA-directed DNA polymerase|nr:group II intron reverse transcriptase/maturase [Alphaproteobacteria bacterium]